MWRESVTKPLKTTLKNKKDMARSQDKSARKISGGRYHYVRGKRKHELAGFPSMTKLDAKKKARTIRKLGGKVKTVLITGNVINVLGKGKATETEILNVIENPANPNLVRRNVITKGCVVETKLGKARVTNRPGQEGCINGVLV